MQEAPALRPLSVGDIIDRMLRLFRANPLLFIGIAVIPNLIVEVVERASGLSQTFDPSELSALFGSSGGVPVLPIRHVDPVAASIAGIVAVLVALAQAGALIYAVGRRYLGRPVTVREAYTSGLRAAPRVVLSSLVVAVVGIVLFVAFFLALTGLAAVVPAAAVILGLVWFFFVLPWAFLSLTLIWPSIVLEGLGPIAAIRRSFHLIDRARLRTLGLFCLLVIISIVLGIILSVIFLASFMSEPTVRVALQTIANAASASVSGPLLYGAIVILYYDLRVRKEAFDLQLAAEALPREG